MLTDFLKEVVSIVVGKNSEQIADLLNSKKHVNEFIIAKKLDITINQTRNILYRLSDHGLVSSIRKKDKKKGWYTYFWKLEILKALEFLREAKLKRLGQMSNQIKNRETKEFYICERCNIEINEENALLHDFTCNECGEIFSRKDNTKVLKELKKYSEKISSEVAAIDKEIDIERSKIEKAREKQLKKEKAEKAAKRAAKRKATKKAKTQKSKKKPKKKPKKRVKKKIKKLLKTVRKAVKKKVVKKKKAKGKKKVVKKKKVKKSKKVKKTSKKKRR
jgi:transcription factor E